MSHDQKRPALLQNHNTFLFYAMVLALVYFNALGGDFIFDDRHYVIENHLVKHLDLPNLYALFTSFYGWDYLPLTLLSLNIDYAVWGLNPLGYHLTNWLLHLVNGFLLYRIVHHLSRSPGAAFWTAFLFLVHPLHVETVAWIAERKNVLSLMFLLLAFYRYRISGPGPGSLALFLLACLAKSSAVTFPLLLILNDLCFSEKPVARLVRDKIPYFLISLAIAAVTILTQTQGGVVREHPGGTPLLTAISMMVVFKEYLWKFLVPVNLNVWYANPLVTSLSTGQLACSFLTDGLFIICCVWSWRHNKTLFFGLLWFVITLLPVSHLVPIPQMMADRFLYLPSLGGIGVCVCLFRKFGEIFQGRHYLFRNWVAVGIVIGFLILDINRIPVFQRETALWQDSVRRDDRNTLTLMYLGLAYQKEGDLDTALDQLARARQIDPGNYRAGLYQAMILEEKKEPESAEQAYTSLLRQYPDKAETYTHLGVLQGRQGRVIPALANLNRALALDPHLALAHYNRGVFLFRIGEPREALAALQNAVEQDPKDAMYHFQLGKFYFTQTDRPDLGQRHLAMSLRLDPDQVTAGEIRNLLSAEAPSRNKS